MKCLTDGINSLHNTQNDWMNEWTITYNKLKIDDWKDQS